MPTLTATTVGVEVLDSPAAEPQLVRRMLTDIARSNRWLGGERAVRTGLRMLRLMPPQARPLTLLDVGTGAGDLPLAVARWARAHHLTIRGVGVERHRTAAQLAHDNGVACAVACGSALPFRNSGTGDGRRAMAPAPRLPSPVAVGTTSIDIVLISQLLHHFDDDTAVTLIREAASIARLGVILTDLRPMTGAATAFRLAGRALRFHPATIADGIVSLARGRSARALAALARRAGIVELTARDLSLARVVVAFRTDH